MKKIRIFILFIFFYLNIINLQASEIDYTKSYLAKYGYDYDSKSIRGWIRVFKSDKKLEEYEIVVKEKEREKILFLLKKNYDEFRKKYKRGIE